MRNKISTGIYVAKNKYNTKFERSCHKKKKNIKYQSDKQIDGQNCYLGRVWTQDLSKLIETVMDFHSRAQKSFAENEKDLIL